MTGPPISVLNVAEKPSVARALAGVFSTMPGAQDRPMQRGEAQIFQQDGVKFPSVHQQGEGRLVNGPIQAHNMITTSVRGHLASQDFPNEYGWSACPPIALFSAPIETSYDDRLERMLRDLSRRVQVLILWLDCDREGEAIGEEVKQVCLAGNPRLNVLRAKFSTVLPQEIQRALKTLGRLNMGFVQAVQARSQLDLRVGAAFTRFQTLRLQKKFDCFSSVLSYGPCQFPTLGFVVERWARIETFRPEDYWYIELMLQIGNSTRPICFTWKRTRLYDRVLAMALYESCVDVGEATVVRLTGCPKNKWRPVPLATVELQKRASRYLRISSETLMSAAEELYQQGYISYPRTETERFRPEFQHHPLIQEFTNIGGDIGGYATKLLQGNNFQMPRAGQHDDNAHPPITPCKAVDPTSIGDATQRNVYILIVKHYLACCSRDAIGKETQLVVRMGSEEFTAKGLMIMEKNWLEIYHPWERWSTGQGELPPCQVGSRIAPSSLLLKDGRTTPPPPISEVELISLMDRNGIGTDATIAQHIATILTREYAIKDASLKFHPTKLGIALVEGYNSMGYQLNKPDLRREMEAECNQVALGRKTANDIVGPILNKMKECFQRVNAEAHKLDEAVARHFSRLGVSNDTSTVLQRNFSECGECQDLMTLKQATTATGNNNVRRKLLYCGNCQLGLGLPRGGMEPHTNDNGTPIKCPICQYQVIRIVRGDGYNGNGYHVCPKCFSDPPMEHGGAQNADFRCFSCQHPTCTLAGGTQGGDVEVYPCPFCAPQGHVMLKKTSRGHLLSCNAGRNACSYTVWLPKEASSISIPDNAVCQACSNAPNKIVRKVHLVWKPGSVPPHLGGECTVCVLCDSDFREDLQVRLPQPGQVVPRARGGGGNAQQRGRGGGGRGNGQQRGRGGGGGRENAPRARAGRGRGAPAQQGNNRGNGDFTCYKCGQPGHFANACPQA